RVAGYRAADRATDDLGNRVGLAERPRRIVSLVPSLTEALAATSRELLAGATDYCTHPADLDVPRVGGSRFPDPAVVRALRPDLVLANAEENRPEDLAALRAAGIPVWVTAPTTLAAAFTSLRRMLAACGLPAPPWLDAARAAWASTYDGSEAIASEHRGPAPPMGPDADRAAGRGAERARSRAIQYSEATGSEHRGAAPPRGLDPDSPAGRGAERARSRAIQYSPPRHLAVVPIWRRPWRVVGAGTFGGDVLRQLGIANAFGAAAERYPKVTPE